MAPAYLKMGVPTHRPRKTLMPPALRAIDSALPQAGFKTAGMNWSNRELRGQDFTRIAGRQAEAVKLGGSWFHGYRKGQGPRNHGSNSKARKAASALIAKIPLPVSRHIGAVFYPGEIAA